MPGYYDEEGVSDRSPSMRDESRDSQDEKTALIPESLCPGMKPGDEVVLKIVAVHEDEYEVAYSKKDEEEKESEKERMPSMEKAMENNRAPTSFLED